MWVWSGYFVAKRIEDSLQSIVLVCGIDGIHYSFDDSTLGTLATSFNNRR